MAHSEYPGSEHDHHIIPKKTLFSVFGALVMLTILTVAVAQVDLGSAINIILALAVASAKASLVVTFFMALKYDKKVNSMVFSIGTLFVGIFLVFTLFDTAFRGDLGNVGIETISAEKRTEKKLEAQDPGAAGLAIAPGDSARLTDQLAADTTAAADSVAAAPDSAAAASGGDHGGGGSDHGGGG
jgi:cytochrome c oxidase subunit 4